MLDVISISFIFLDSVIDSLDEEEGNMDPSDAENRNDLEESSKQEVNSLSMIILLSLLRSIIIGILDNS